MQPVFESETGHTMSIVESSAVAGLIALDGEPVTANVRQVAGCRSIVNLVSVLPSGVGIVPGGMCSALTRTPEIPAITSPISLITRGEPSPLLRRFLDLYTREMQFLR